MAQIKGWEPKQIAEFRRLYRKYRFLDGSMAILTGIYLFALTWFAFFIAAEWK